jgi:hypothetical protein
MGTHVTQHASNGIWTVPDFLLDDLRTNAGGKNVDKKRTHHVPNVFDTQIPPGAVYFSLLVQAPDLTALLGYLFPTHPADVVMTVP